MTELRPFRHPWLRRAALGLLLLGVVASSAPAAWEPDPVGVQRQTLLTQIREATRGVVFLGMVVLTVVGSVGAMLLAAARSPERVIRAEHAVRRGPWAASLVGLLSTVLPVFLVAVLAKRAPPLAVLLFVLAMAFLVWLAAYGLAGTAKMIGQRLLGDAEGAQPLWRLVGVGALAIGAVGLLPVFGTVLFLFFFLRAIGAAILTLFAAAPDPAASNKP